MENIWWFRNGKTFTKFTLTGFYWRHFFIQILFGGSCKRFGGRTVAMVNQIRWNHSRKQKWNEQNWCANNARPECRKCGAFARFAHLFKIIVQSPWSSANGNFIMEAFVDSLNSFSISSMSNTNGSCPKFASTISPGVCNPTVGYNFDYAYKKKKFTKFHKKIQAVDLLQMWKSSDDEWQFTGKSWNAMPKLWPFFV